MKSDRVLRLIQSGQHERAYVSLYSNFYKVKKHIAQNSGTREEAQDIFQEGLIILYRRVNNSSLELPDQFSCEGYLINSCKLLWSNEVRKKKVRQHSSSIPEKIVFEDTLVENIEKESKLRSMENILTRLGEKCKNILEQFYFHAISMEQIAAQFGFKTLESAKVQKYKCMESARKMAFENKEMLNLQNDRI